MLVGKEVRRPLSPGARGRPSLPLVETRSPPRDLVESSSFPEQVGVSLRGLRRRSVPVSGSRPRKERSLGLLSFPTSPTVECLLRPRGLCPELFTREEVVQFHPPTVSSPSLHPRCLDSPFPLPRLGVVTPHKGRKLSPSGRGTLSSWSVSMIGSLNRLNDGPETKRSSQSRIVCKRDLWVGDPRSLTRPGSRKTSTPPVSFPSCKFQCASPSLGWRLSRTGGVRRTNYTRYM